VSLPDRPDPLGHEQRRARRPAGGAAPLRRAREGRRIAGIAAGIAAFVGADPRAVRALFVLTIPLSLGLTVPGYLLLWLLLPADA
jgi:phage shock protein PspC (stress-responsive transcriptional regulator)